MSHTVKFYQHSNFGGTSHNFKEGEYPTIPSVGNDRTSSIKIAEGYYAQLFVSQGFQGESIYLFTGEYNTLPSWGDKIGSAKIFKYNAVIFPLVTFYEHSDFKGYSQTLAATESVSDYDSPLFRHDTISSIKVPESTIVTIYQHSNLTGKYKELKTGDHYNLGILGWDNKVSSIKIQRSSLELETIEYLEEKTIEPNGEIISIVNTLRNDSNVDQTETVILARELTKSVTNSWSDSTMEGLSVSATASVGVEGVGVSAEVSTTVGATLENTFTITNEQTESEAITFGKELSVTTPPQTISTTSLTLTPKRYLVKVRYTFKIEGTDKREILDGEFIIDSYHEGQTTIESHLITDETKAV